MSIGLGCTTLEVTGMDEELYGALHRRFSAFESKVPASLTIQIERAAAEHFVPFEPGQWEYRVHTERADEYVRASGIAFAAELELNELHASLAFGGSSDLFSQAVENVGRLLLATMLLRSGGLLFHSAAIVDEGQARLFVGRSGAGKTTLSRMMRDRGLTVTSDELNAVTFDESGRPILWGTPFAGDFGPTRPDALGPHPLAGIFLLEQAPENRTIQARGARAYGSLFAAAPFANAESALVPELETSLERFVGDVPVHILRFLKDPSVWDVVAA